MNENSRLRPQAIKHQCDAAVDVLEKDNEALRTVGKSLDQFVADNELESQSFGELKEHMEDYRLVLNSMTAANNEDIADYNYLKSHVGSQDIDGVVVLAQMDKAEEGFNSAERLVEKYRRMSYSTSYDPITAQSMRAQAQMYECSAALWRQIYDCWKQKEETYDQIESSTASLFTAGPLMRADICSALETFGVSGKYQTKGNPLWRQKLQDGEISETRRELLKMGVTKQQLQHMEEIGYLPKEVKAILESCETEEDRVFFGYLMEGTAESYIKAFAVNPKYLSDGMTVALADYAWRILELDEEQKSTKESEKRLTDFSNALLQAGYFVNYDTEATPSITHRDVYWEKLSLGTELLIRGDLYILTSMQPDQEGYKKLYSDYEKKLRMKNLWMTQENLFSDLTRIYPSKGVGCKINKLSFDGESIYFEFEHLRDSMTNLMEVDRIKSRILDNGSALVNFDDRKVILELEQEKEQAFEKFVGKLALDLTLDAFAVYAPGAAIILSSAAGFVNGELPDIEGLDSLAETDRGKLALNALNTLASDTINSYTDFMNTSAELDKKEWEIAQSWFGMGGVYEILDENYEADKLAYNFTGQYDPNVLRCMNEWEKEGIGAWLPEEMFADMADENGDVNMKKVVRNILGEVLKEDISEKEKENCRKLLYGEQGMFEEMDMGEFLDAVRVIEDIESARQLDIKTLFSYTIDKGAADTL